MDVPRRSPRSGIGPTTEDDGEGWHAWRRRRNQGNQTLLDDNTTASAIRFLAHLDQALDPPDPRIGEAVRYALESVLRAQYPNGAWSHNYDRFPAHRPDLDRYPVLPASYPPDRPRTWPKDFTGCYYLNDNLTPDMIRMLSTSARSHQSRYFEAAERRDLCCWRRCPTPARLVPAVCRMQPVWDNKLSRPRSWRGRRACETLLLLYRRTAN